MTPKQIRAAKSRGAKKSIRLTNARLGPEGRSARSAKSHPRKSYFAVGLVPIPYEKRVKWCRRGGKTRGAQNVAIGLVGKFGLSLHVRWHVNRNRTNSKCKHCKKFQKLSALSAKD
jgi:hypothetical protein